MRKGFLMRKISLLAIALLFPFAFSLPAHALSVDRDSGINTDGSSKFADPDEQMPYGVTGPQDDAPSPHATPSVLLPMTPNSSAGFSVNHFGTLGGQQQPDAFDQAYGRK